MVISSKNVFAPGAQFGAYSATKAAAHQLARIASLELAQIDVRVNMVSPDAVFSEGERQSGLWAEVGPDRMRSRGLDEQGLEDYYRNRNLLKAKVTAEHVANAALFFCTRQTPTTGATIPVDGGLPEATPPLIADGGQRKFKIPNPKSQTNSKSQIPNSKRILFFFFFFLRAERARQQDSTKARTHERAKLALLSPVSLYNFGQ